MILIAVVAAAVATASPSPSAAATTSPPGAASAAPAPIATLVPIPTLTPSPTPVPTPAKPASVAIVWHLGPAPYADESVRAAAMALWAPLVIGPQLRALRAHPRAHFSFAIDAGGLTDLPVAAAGDTALQAMLAGHLGGGARLAEMLRLLAQAPVLGASLASTPAARRYAALARTAALAAAGRSGARLTTQDYTDLVGLAAVTYLAAAQELPADAPALHKSSLTPADATAALVQMERADSTVLEELKAQAHAGRLELLADPSGEPILPLLIDGGGKSGPNIVLVGAEADAAYSVDSAIRAVTALAPDTAPAVYSPHGAYDDEAASLLERHHAAFALFSDRVLRSSPIGGSQAAVAGADTAAFHAYALHAASGAALSTLFWSQDDGKALDVLSPRLPASAMGARVVELAKAAGARAGAGSILILRIEADGLWNRRADRTQVVDDLASTLGSGVVPSVTIGEYVRTTPAATGSYGFSPASDEGSLTYWMGTADQASLWNALSDARKAAGGDAAVTREATRNALLEAEASRWYAVPTMIAPAAEIARLLDSFREAIAAIYRSAGRPAPASIAPVRLGAPTPPPGH